MSLRIAVVLFEGVTALDAVGPMEMLGFLPGAELVLVSDGGGMVTTDSGVLQLGPTLDVRAAGSFDVVLVPGGPGTAAALRSPLVAWLAETHKTTQWTVSVCSGALLLGAAGLLADLEATSHFAVLEHLSRFGARPVVERVVVQPEARIITAAGVSAGIDMALSLIGLLTDQVTASAIQLITEYDPHPPLLGGHLPTAEAGVIDRAIELGTPRGAIPAGWRPGAS